MHVDSPVCQTKVCKYMIGLSARVRSTHHIHVDGPLGKTEVCTCTQTGLSVKLRTTHAK